MPGTDHADGLARENFIKVFDSDMSFQEKLDAAKKRGLPPGACFNSFYAQPAIDAERHAVRRAADTTKEASPHHVTGERESAGSNLSTISRKGAVYAQAFFVFDGLDVRVPVRAISARAGHQEAQHPRDHGR
jgi:hypothetical protein